MEKKTIWIFNHYATGMFFNRGGRHYSFAKHLLGKGYQPVIFCASTRHKSKDQEVKVKGSYTEHYVEDIPFVFVKTFSYESNGIARILNMLGFYFNLIRSAKKYRKKHGKPDVILASSVHPLSLVAGTRESRKCKVPCICEIRDLWPESLVEYGALRRNSLLAKILYQGEKWIYKRADKLIFTMEGGRDYIIHKGWHGEAGGPIDLDKVYHINNGVDLESFNYNRLHYELEDEDLQQEGFKVIYAGSLRRVNNVKTIVETAEIIKKRGRQDIKFLIYGAGDQREYLERYCEENNVTNVIFKGKVEKSYIPYILSKGSLNILHFEQNSLKRYGASLNKLFEYFASGRPTLSDCEFAYDLIKRYNCGLVAEGGNKEELADMVIRFASMPLEEYLTYCHNGLRAAQDYDFKILTEKLIALIEN